MYKERLKALREEKELKLYFLSELLDLNKDVYGQYEREYVIMPIKHLNTICNYFNVSIDYVFGFTNIKQYNNSIKEINLIKSGERLKEFRKQKNYTQAKLADILNIARAMISKYEKGEFIIATHTLYTICKEFKVSADYLLGKIDSNTFK